MHTRIPGFWDSAFLKGSPISFGHCPNSHWTPPSNGHSEAPLNRCPKPSWQGFRPPRPPPKWSMPKWTQIFLRLGFSYPPFFSTGAFPLHCTPSGQGAQPLYLKAVFGEQTTKTSISKSSEDSLCRVLAGFSSPTLRPPPPPPLGHLQGGGSRLPLQPSSPS